MVLLLVSVAGSCGSFRASITNEPQEATENKETTSAYSKLTTFMTQHQEQHGSFGTPQLIRVLGIPVGGSGFTGGVQGKRWMCL